jgi:hypothetical protein
MKPFVVFRAPNTVKWSYRPQGKRIYKIRIWIKLPFATKPEVNELITKQPCTISEIKPIIDDNANELMDLLQCTLYEYWAKFLLSITDATTDQEMDNFVDNFPQSDYGFECYVWR